jgi:hypothetical protein
VGTLSRPALLTLTSADGRINCQFGTDVSAFPADTWAPEQVVRFTTEYSDQFRDVPSETFAEETGVAGVELTGASTADLYIDSAYYMNADPPPVSGSLMVYARYDCGTGEDTCSLDGYAEEAVLSFP